MALLLEHFYITGLSAGRGIGRTSFNFSAKNQTTSLSRIFYGLDAAINK